MPDFIEPEYPCRNMATRGCPASYADVCGDRPCARFESEDPEPWSVEIERLQRIRAGQEFLASVLEETKKHRTN